MKITEYERGHNDASGEAIAWLHAEALRMNDPHARQILNPFDYQERRARHSRPR